jgi:hypothetical protein
MQTCREDFVVKSLSALALSHVKTRLVGTAEFHSVAVAPDSGALVVSGTLKHRTTDFKFRASGRMAKIEFFDQVRHFPRLFLLPIIVLVLEVLFFILTGVDGNGALASIIGLSLFFGSAVLGYRMDDKKWKEDGQYVVQSREEQIDSDRFPGESLTPHQCVDVLLEWTRAYKNAHPYVDQT